MFKRNSKLLIVKALTLPNRHAELVSASQAIIYGF